MGYTPSAPSRSDRLRSALLTVNELRTMQRPAPHTAIEPSPCENAMG